jgi:hypothetical protein
MGRLKNSTIKTLRGLYCAESTTIWSADDHFVGIYFFDGVCDRKGWNHGGVPAANVRHNGTYDVTWHERPSRIVDQYDINIIW